MKDKAARTILTNYFDENEIHIRTNCAVHANNAVLCCVNHMQLNHYGASVAEVYDSMTGELHAVITYDFAGKMEIIFKREVKENTQ